MKIPYGLNNVFALLLFLIFLTGCSKPAQKNKHVVTATIPAIENAYYTYGNFNKAFDIAANALQFYRDKNDIKHQAEALLWMAAIKKNQSAYTISFKYLKKAGPLINKAQNDSLYATFYTLKGELYIAGLATDSAAYNFNKARKIIGTGKAKNTFLRARLDLGQLPYFEHLQQTNTADSLSQQSIKDLAGSKGYPVFYYNLALLNRVLFVNKNGNADTALSMINKYAVQIDRSFPNNSYLHILVNHALAGVSINNMDYAASIKYAKKERSFALASNNPILLFNADHDMQQAYFYNTDFKNALAFTDSMDHQARITFPAKSLQSSLVNNCYGRLFTNTHDYGKAKYYFLRNIKLNGSIFGKNSEEFINFYSNMANLYSYQERYDSVLYYYGKVLALEKNIYTKDNIAIAFCMDDMARTYNNMDKPKLALPLQIAVEEMYLKKYGPKHSYVAWGYDAEADSYGLLRQYDKAIQYSNKALGMFIPNMATDTSAIDHTAAIPFDIYIPDYMTSRVDIFFNRAENTTDRKQKTQYLKEAYRLCNATNKFIQAYATHFDSPESVAGLYQRMYDYYKISADISYELFELTGDEKYRNSILNYAENKRGAFLRSTVLSSKTVQFSGVPAAVIQRETAIRNEVTAAADRSVAVSKKDSINKVYEQFLSYLSSHYNNYYRLKYLPYVLNERDVQQWLPDTNTVFAEYLISKKQVYIMLIGKQHASIIKLEKKDEVLAQIGDLSLLLKNYDAKTYYKKAYNVYKELVKPLEQYVKPGNKIIISADGPLSALSFEALVTKPAAPNNQFNKADFLINKYNFSYAISAFSLLNPFDKEHLSQTNKKAYYAAPGFDDHLKSDYKQFAADNQLPVDKDYLLYLYQPFMIKLGNALSSSWNVTKKVGNDATESDFKQKAPGNNILQIGSHALLNDIDPMKSCLVFAKELSTDNKANDGYLYSSEIYNQKLNADLVILTACETGAGKYKEGEGMMSLSYGFAYAGCKSAIMSLWPIDEKTASTITELFYKHLGEGQTTADALYNAKKDFLKKADAELSDPFYWSGLVLLGNNEKIHLEQNNTPATYSLIFGAIGVLTIGAVGFKKWKR
ncbi:CHAT domain-containing protein [Mucilaginibacter sp.]|uniref:CHAT domain-containing protein n=1 Tax=Mucilaginibacter sp. TaxID=1882438 RepID=UPI003D0CA341